MKNKILYKFLPVFFSLLIVCSVPMKAVAAVGVGSMWDGVISVSSDDSTDLFVEYSYSTKNYTNNDGSVSEADSFYIYEGGSDHIVEVNSNSSDIYLNGYIQKRVNVSVDLSVITQEYGYRGNLDVSATPVVLDNIYITVLPISSSVYGCVFDIYIHFDDYYVNHTDIQIPINIDFKYALQMFSYQNSNLVPRIPLNLSVSADYGGDIQQYDNLEDVPSVDGYFAEQNTTIINQSQIQNNLTTEQNTLIQNQTQQQHSDSQAEINQSIQNTDQITNGYSDQSINNADAAFNDGAGDLSAIEDNLSSSSSQYIDNYADSAFDASFLDTISPSLGFVVTWFTNFWNIGGGLTATYTLSFAIFIAFYIIRVRA